MFAARLLIVNLLFHKAASVSRPPRPPDIGLMSMMPKGLRFIWCIGGSAFRVFLCTKSVLASDIAAGMDTEAGRGARGRNLLFGGISSPLFGWSRDMDKLVETEHELESGANETARNEFKRRSRRDKNTGVLEYHADLLLQD